MVVMEDADLIARPRAHMRSPCEESLLNKLLNEMDGLREDAMILFILTTNNPEQLETALTSRPGRIDQAIEFPLPDDDGRRKLVHLYSRQLEVPADLVEGRFRIPKLYADADYLLRVRARGYDRKWTQWMRVRSGEPVSSDIRLRDAPSAVAGKVVDGQGKPVAKTRVVMGHLCIPDAVTETDTEGHFRIDSLLPEQAVDLWANGKTLKTNAGAENLVIVVP
jgi:hypothetical protein